MADIEGVQKLRTKFKEFEQKTSISRSSAPLIYDVGQRALIGGAAGFASSFFLFKSWSLRMFFMFTGLGVGLGMNYSQMNVLWHAARGTIDVERNTDEIMKEIGAL